MAIESLDSPRDILFALHEETEAALASPGDGLKNVARIFELCGMYTAYHQPFQNELGCRLVEYVNGAATTLRGLADESVSNGSKKG